jgi:hypothetical protein
VSWHAVVLEEREREHRERERERERESSFLNSTIFYTLKFRNDAGLR